MEDFQKFLQSIGKAHEWELLPEEYDLGKTFWQNTIVRLLLVSCFLFLVGGLLILGSVIFPRELPVVLAYNVYFGVSILGVWWQVFLWPALALFLLVVNVLLAWHYYVLRERLVGYVLLLAALFIQIGFVVFIIGLALTNF